MRRWRARSLVGLFNLGFLIIAGLGGCGASPDGEGASRLRVSFALEKGGAAVACANLTEIEQVRVTAWSPDRLTRRAGFPITAPASACADGFLEVPSIPDGDHVIEVAALGVLGGEPGAVLFTADAPVSTPSSDGLSITLRPEVAYLTVSWTFEDLGLAPCASEVGDVEVIVSAGSRSNLSRRFPCAAVPASIPVPLPLASSTIQIDAYSPEGFILFYATEQRVLARGDNALSATLGATGGRIFLDWNFRIGGQTIRACDEDRVSAIEVVASVRNLAGGPVAFERIPCGEDRPIVFGPQRYPAGQELEIELVAETPRTRFRGVERLTMPQGDRLTDPPVAMDAVGSATVAFSVGRAECEALGVDEIEISVRDVAGQGPPIDRLTRKLPAAVRSTRFDDLPYGEYEIEVSIRVADRPVCSSLGRRTIDGRVSDWLPFVL